MNKEIISLIEELQRFDNEEGYKMEYQGVKGKLEPVVRRLIYTGEEGLEHLHHLLEHEETWSCLFALEILKEIKSEKSIPHLIEFIKKNEDGDYGESCEEAMHALSAMGERAVTPLLKEVKACFAEKRFLIYLVGALTEIKHDSVYAFMVEIIEDYLKGRSKYEGWFNLEMFVCDFVEQGRKEALPLLKGLLDTNLLRFERIEIEDAIKAIEDPEGYKRELKYLKEILKPLLSLNQEKAAWGLAEMTPELTFEDYLNAQDLILEFMEEGFPKHKKRAEKEFREIAERLLNAKTLDDGKLTSAFVSWYITQFTIDELTPAEIFFNEECKKTGMLQRVVRKMCKPRMGFFEVVSRKGRIYTLYDVLHEERIEMVTGDLEELPEKTFFCATLIPFNYFQWISYGPLSVFGLGDNRGSKAIEEEISKKRAVIEKNKKEFERFFGKMDPEFSSMNEAQQSMVNFLKHQNPDIRADIKTLDEEFERVGLVMTEAGITIVPYYGYVKDIVKGGYESVPDWKVLLENIIKEDCFIPDCVLRGLVYSNKEASLEAFKKAYPFIKSFKDVETFLWEWRPFIFAKETPKVELVGSDEQKGHADGKLQKAANISEKRRKTGRNDPCPCGSGKKYKKCCLRKGGQ